MEEKVLDSVYNKYAFLFQNKSEYLTKVNKAKEFHYTASWKEKLWVKK